MKNKGFTLIEILVVVLIIGITLGFAMMAFGDFGEKRRIVISAEQFANYVKLVQQQAILETSTLGISFKNNTYQVLRFQPPSSWSPMQATHIFRQQQFPKGVMINLRHAKIKPGTPTIIINSSGDMTAFTLDFGTAKEASLATIIGARNGALTVQTVKSP